MGGTVELLGVSLTPITKGAASAVATFEIADDRDFPGWKSFRVEVRFTTPETRNVIQDAKRAFHGLTRSLADQTKEWA